MFTDASELSWAAIDTHYKAKEAYKGLDKQRHGPLAFLKGQFTSTQRKLYHLWEWSIYNC